MFVFIMFMNFPRTAQYNFLSLQVKECRKICLTFTKSNIYTIEIRLYIKKSTMYLNHDFSQNLKNHARPKKNRAMTRLFN